MSSAVRVEETCGGARSADPLEGGIGGSHTDASGSKGRPTQSMYSLCPS